MQFKYVPLSGKIPLYNDWQNNVSCDPAQLNVWSQATNEFGIATGQGFIVIDVDVKEHNGFANLAARGITLPPTLTQTTQSGGAHFFYKTNATIKNSTSKLAKGVDVRSTGGQVKVYDWTIIHKADQMVNLPKDIEDFLTKEVETKKQIPVRFLNPETELENILLELMDAAEGERNATLFVKSCEIKSKLINNGQLNQDAVYEKVYNTAIQMGLKSSEVKATVKSGFRTTEVFSLPFVPVVVSDMRGLDNTKSKWLPSKPTMSDLRNKSKLRKPSIFKDYSSRDITLLNADGGTGKTTKLLFETIHAALGLPCYGFIPTGKFKTLFVVGEDDAEKLYAILGSICEALNLNEEQLKQVCDMVRIKKDIDLLLISKDRMGFLIPNYAALNEIVKELQSDEFIPDRVIFDPIASFWGSEAALNDMSKAVAKWCGLLRDALNCEVILVNHIGKASSQSKDITQFAGRGGSALPSHARINRVMRRIDATEYTEMTGNTLNDNEQALLEICTKYTDYSPILDKPMLYLRKGFTFGLVEITKQNTDTVKDTRSDDEIVYEFILENQTNGIECSKKFIESMLAGKISRARIGDTLTRLTMVGLNGKKILLLDAEDLTKTEKVFKIQGE